MRCTSWHEHVLRGGGVLSDLVSWQNSDWLQSRRAAFVAQNGSASSRNSLFAGRTGTRCNIGRPQVRWDTGIALARGFLDSRWGALVGRNTLSVSSRIRNAVAAVSEFFGLPP